MNQDTLPQTTDRLPPEYRYTVYASVVEAGVATLWDANARTRSGEYVAGASGDTPAEALAALAREMAHG